ncbi:hypothetical protein SynBIOSE41_04194 [Synechococcus sp. BIOS-E4-1]|uniref:DUF2062 domain-containing protein n=1 Tax=Synechococcus sp. BIOS-E4-1 TaxID=1400864 RepID=UPI0016473DCD|nr:DUF2062 domain-containing protein [Synechococcus sp. BIOS-E4-1]QNI56649.1 hypothetical protein SynBIOSE41_04194 [Synechococcus sp. BIOS-E4-1]
MGRMLRKAHQRLQKGLQWIWQQEGTPGQRARGLAAGIFCGCFPIFGLQTLVGIALASVVRGNHLLAAAGTWISNPFTYLPLYWFNYRIGALLLGPGREWPGFDALHQEGFNQLGWSVISRLLLGSSITGAVCSALGWWLSLNWLLQQQRKRCGQSRSKSGTAAAGDINHIRH